VIEMRLFVFIGALVLSGVLLGWFVASFECRRRYLVQKQTKQRINALENEVTSLRTRQQTPVAGHSPSPTQLPLVSPSVSD
jgi:hypothetical protein